MWMILAIWFIVSYTFDSSIATPIKAFEMQPSGYIDNERLDCSTTNNKYVGLYTSGGYRL